MKKRRSLGILPAALLFCAALVGSAFAAAEDALWITDHLGREVQIRFDPQRVLALHRTFIEDLIVLGVVPVGRVQEYRLREEASSLPSIGREGSPDLEVIYALAPDLILANARQHAPLLDALELSGATVFFVDPSQLDEDPMLDRIMLFAELLDLRDVAGAYAVRLNALSDMLREQVETCGDRTSIILQGGSESVLAAQPTGMYHAILERLGLENVVPQGLPGAGRSTWVGFDIEAIMEADPDLVLVRSAGSGEGEESLLSYYLSAPQWNGLRAIQENRLIVLPAEVNPGAISNEAALRVVAGRICADSSE
jgi:ABC-type Fe3+-hydroxamate transport system substrate-binding protein